MEIKCKNCEHSLICKFKLDYEKFVLDDLKVHVPAPFELEVICPHYKCQYTTSIYGGCNSLSSVYSGRLDCSAAANVAAYTSAE